MRSISKRALVVLLVSAFAVTTWVRDRPLLPWFTWGTPATLASSWAPDPATTLGLKHIARVDGRRLLLSTHGGEVDFFPGVNIGPTVPGRVPGEQAIPRADYRRWFPQIASLGLRAVRVYTILRPSFYQELERFNQSHPYTPIYLVQGVWIPEDAFYEHQDLFTDDVREVFKEEITSVVGAVHGDLTLPERLGYSSGTYTSDVSRWLLAYSVGIEWDPAATHASDRKNEGVAAYSGRFFSSRRGASPTEVWLAEILDHTASEEAARGWTMPLTFTNWPTADPLAHPMEPSFSEDLVGIDANHIRPEASWPGGYFASFHVYPYFPDFMHLEPGLAEFRYHGRSDPYAGYLAKLREHFSDMPLVVTEFGIPSSSGNAHFGPLGRDQGDHSEQESMAANAEILRMMSDLDLSGAFVFEWADEWFKFTWNTLAYELPGGRRQLWRNPWTNEENFGLIAADAGLAPVVTIDGHPGEWEDNGSQVILEGQSPVREVRAVKDEAYLYLRIVLDDENAVDLPGAVIGFDVLEGSGSAMPGAPGSDPLADYAISFRAGHSAQAWVLESNNPAPFFAGAGRSAFDIKRVTISSQGAWDPVRLITNRALTRPDTGRELSIEDFNVGALRYGTTDPTDPPFDSRNSWAMSPGILEIRIPYAAIGFSDPSSRQILKVTPEGFTTVPVDKVGISMTVSGHDYKTDGYSWDPWNEVQWHERPKAGIEEFVRAVADVTPVP